MKDLKVGNSRGEMERYRVDKFKFRKGLYSGNMDEQGVPVVISIRKGTKHVLDKNQLA